MFSIYLFNYTRKKKGKKDGKKPKKSKQVKKNGALLKGLLRKIKNDTSSNYFSFTALQFQAKIKYSCKKIKNMKKTESFQINNLYLLKKILFQN